MKDLNSCLVGWSRIWEMKVELWYSHMAGSMLLQNCWWSPAKYTFFTCYKTRWYNSYHANKCVDVQHGKKSLDYRPLMNVINQCEEISPLISMSAKVPKYILQSVNKGFSIKPLARSNDQGALMYSHDFQGESLPLRYACLKVLKMNSSLYPR